MKVLLVSFSDNADHQDICYSMFKSVNDENRNDIDLWMMGIDKPKIDINDHEKLILVDCPKRPGIEKKTFDLLSLNRIIKWIRKQNFDVILFESLHVWNLPIMLVFRKKAKLMQMIHDLIPHAGDRQEKSVDMMNRIVCRLSDRIIICNRKYIDKVTELYGVPRDRVLFIDLWRNFPVYTQPKYTGRALFFGRLNPYKGVDNLMEIVGECPEISFDVIGRVDPQVENQVRMLKEMPNVTVNNQYVTNEQMAEAFINADWVLLPYDSATQSGVVIDAYRFGRPCIAFNVGAISEQIWDEHSGFLIQEGDNRAFANKLKYVHSLDRVSYDRFSKEAYQFGCKKYSATGAINRFIELVRN